MNNRLEEKNGLEIACQCKNDNGGRCREIIARIKNGVFVITLRHYGEDLTSYFTLADIDRLSRQEKERRDPVLR